MHKVNDIQCTSVLNNEQYDLQTQKYYAFCMYISSIALIALIK